MVPGMVRAMQDLAFLPFPTQQNNKQQHELSMQHVKVRDTLAYRKELLRVLTYSPFLFLFSASGNKAMTHSDEDGPGPL